LQIHRLVAHPNFGPFSLRGLSVRWSDLRDGRLMLRYQVEGCASLVLPPPAVPERADELWRNTCFELFLYDGEGRYREFNFSPSQQWAAYRFSGYRSDMQPFDPVCPPEIVAEKGNDLFILTVFLNRADIKPASRGALSAVLEEPARRLSYWALKHGGERPDFHDPACFRLAIAPAQTS
jgi:hypothetical protein